MGAIRNLSENSWMSVLVFGRVQGVFFRAWTQEQAQDLKLRGWVRNSAEGTVQICAEGPKDKLQELLKRCEQGPPAARVEKVEVKWEPSSQKTLESKEAPWKGFSIRY